MMLQRLIIQGLLLALLLVGDTIWAGASATPQQELANSPAEAKKSDGAAASAAKPSEVSTEQAASAGIPGSAEKSTAAEAKKLRAEQKAEAAKKVRAEKKAASAQIAQANIPNSLEIAQKVLDKAKKEEENTKASALSSEQEKEIAQKNVVVAESVLKVEQIKKQILDLDNSPTAKEEDKKAAQEKLKIAGAYLLAAKTALEEAKTYKKPPVPIISSTIGINAGGEKQVAAAVASPAPEAQAEAKPEDASASKIIEEAAEMVKQKNGKPEGDLQGPQEAYNKAKEGIEKIVAEARKNPVLKKKLEEAAAKLKELEQALQNAQDVLEVAIKEYYKVKDDPSATADNVKTVRDARAAALEQVKKTNAELKKQRVVYEDLVYATETTKQLRDREYKRALGLKSVREKDLKKAEAALSALDARMDKLMADPKSKDKDLSALEQEIDQAQKHLDKREKKWEEIKREVALAKLRSETVVERCTRERDRAKERLEALQGRPKGKKGKNIEADLALIRNMLAEKEAALRTAQKLKDANELDLAAIAFDPNDPMDEETLEEEMTTPEERAAAKKAFPLLLQNYRAARKTVSVAEKDLGDTEKEYLDITSQNRARDATIKAVTRKLKRLQLALIRAIRAELNAKKDYEIALRQTETLKETRLRVLRELETLVKSLEQRFIEAKQKLTEAQESLTQAQSTKPIDKKAVDLATQKTNFAKARLAGINQDKDLAYKALKIAQEKAARYLTATNKGHGKKHTKRRGARNSSIVGSNREVFEDFEDDQEYEDLEDAPLVYRDESEEDQQAAEELESASAELERIDDETSIAGQIINEELRLETQEAKENLTQPSGDEDSSISMAPTNTFDALAGDQENISPRINNDQGEVGSASSGGRTGDASQDNSDTGAQYLIPGGNPSGGEIPETSGGGEPGAGSDEGSGAGAEGMGDPSVDADAEAKRRADEDETQRQADEEEALGLEDEEEKGLADEEEAVGLAGENDPANPSVLLPNSEDGIPEDTVNHNDVRQARQEADKANDALENAMETGDRGKIINAQIDKEAADIKAAKAQIEQSPYGKEIKPKEQNSWENAYGRDLFDPEAADKGGVFNARPGTSENVSDIVMEGSSLTKPDHLIERPRVMILERTGASASATSKLNADLPTFHHDTGIGGL